MPRIFMPDPDRMPDGLKFSPGLVQNYKTLPEMYLSSWEKFGDGGTLADPKVIQVSKVAGVGNAHIANYAEFVDGLTSAYSEIGKLDSAVLAIARRSRPLCDEGRNDLADSIDALHAMARINPNDLNAIKELIDNGVLDPAIAKNGGNISEDEYVMAIMEAAVNKVSDVMQKKLEDFEKLGSKVREKDPEDAGKTRTKPHVKAEGGPIEPQNTVIGGTADTTAAPGIVSADSSVAPPVWNWDNSGSAPPGLRYADSASPITTDKTGSQDQSTGRAAAGQPVRQADGAPEQKVAQAASETTSPAAVPAGISGMPNYSLPMAAMAGLANRRSQAVAENYRPQENRNQSVPGASAAMSSARSAAPPARPVATSASPALGGSQTPPPVTSAAASGSAAANNLPSRVTAPVHAAAVSYDDDGSTVFTFPDGRAQRVSIPVANALTIALGNAATTDGRSAYDNTPAKIPEGNVLGTPTDPNGLVTGDLASWENRTAIVVAFPVDNGGTLEVIIESRLCPFEPHMSDKHGDFGSFNGFFHPAGVDIPAAASGSGLSATPVDQSVNGPATVPV